MKTKFNRILMALLALVLVMSYNLPLVLASDIPETEAEIVETASVAPMLEEIEPEQEIVAVDPAEPGQPEITADPIQAAISEEVTAAVAGFSEETASIFAVEEDFTAMSGPDLEFLKLTGLNHGASFSLGGANGPDYSAMGVPVNAHHEYTNNDYFFDYYGQPQKGSYFRVEQNGNIGYCVTYNKPGPEHGVGMDEFDPTTEYSYEHLLSLEALLQWGYPMYKGSGLSADAQKYATSLAIQMFNAYIARGEWIGSTATLGDFTAVNYHAEAQATLDYYNFLIQKALNRDVIPVTINFTQPTFTLQGTNFVGTTTVTTQNVSGAYILDQSQIPGGVSISGYTGNSGDVLTISIPKSIAGQDMTLVGQGYHPQMLSNLLWYAPQAGNWQNVAFVTENTTSRTLGFITFGAPPATTIYLYKTDTTTGTAVGLPGAKIEITYPDSSKQTHTYGAGGLLILNDLFPGTYYYREVYAPDGFVYDPNKVYSFTVTPGSVTGDTILENKKTEVILTKTDKKTGQWINGVTVEIFKNGVSQGDFTTAGQGQIKLTGWGAGSYTYKEKSAPPAYYFDPNKVYSFAIDTYGNVTGTRSFDNPYVEVVIEKTDKKTGAWVDNVTIEIFDSLNASKGDFVTSGGKIKLYGWKPGTYTYKEKDAPPGYYFDPNRVYTFTIAADGTVTGETKIDNVYVKAVILKVDRISTDPIQNVKIKLFNPDGSEHGIYTTDIKGEITFYALKPGTYTYKEISAPQGNVFDPNKVYSFTVAANGDVSGDTVFDNDITQLLFTKLDAKTADILDGREFKIKDVLTDLYMPLTFDNVRKAYVWDAASVDEVFTTDKGKAIVERLPKGDYILEEVEEATGFVYPSEIHFTLDDDTNTETPLELTMENEPTRLVFTKIDGQTKELLDGFIFAVKDDTGQIMTLTFDDATKTYNYDPAGEETFTTEKGQAIIDYLPKGKYSIEEQKHDNDKYTPADELPPLEFELTDDTKFSDPLEVEFENWKLYGTVRVYHRRVITKEFLADPYIMTQSVDNPYNIQPDANEIQELTLRMVEVYKTPRNAAMEKFTDLQPIAQIDGAAIEDYQELTDEEFNALILSQSQERDTKNAEFSTMSFDVAGDYSEEFVTTVVYWYENPDVPLVRNEPPGMLTDEIIYGDPDTIPLNGRGVKTGDTKDILIYLVWAAAAGAIILILARKMALDKKERNTEQ